MSDNILKFYKEKINPRIFIVGCSRSGTTLLQTLIASHKDVTTFPETGFFYKTIGNSKIKNTIANLGITVGNEIKCLNNYIIPRLEIDYKISLGSLLYKNNVENFLSVLDEIAIKRNKICWVEKTPFHIFNVDIIEKYVPNVRIIHIVRDGKEVVASIKNRSSKYPEQFKGQDIDYAINLWNKCIDITMNFENKSSHYVIKYEDLVHNTKNELNKIGRFINLDYTDIHFTERGNILKKSTIEKEKWKSNVSNKIVNKNNKFDVVFSESKKKEVINKLIKNKYYSAK